MTEIVVHGSTVYRAERDGQSCHFGSHAGAKAWAGSRGIVTTIFLRHATLEAVETDIDKDIEILRLRGYLIKIKSQSDQHIVWTLVDCALAGEDLDYVK